VKENILYSWSGGKDSALALYELKKNSRYNISSLLTTVVKDYSRSSMHGVRSELIEQQSKFLGLKLDKVFLSKDESSASYSSKMQLVLERYKRKGVFSVGFGDIFLEDIKQYRINNLAKLDMKGVFPLWKKDTLRLAHNFIDLGFKAITTCVDSRCLNEVFVGRFFDKNFLAELPQGIDPCGENGEFHTFVYAGPIFNETIRYKKGEIVLRNNRFYFCDLIPA